MDIDGFDWKSYACLIIGFVPVNLWLSLPLAYDNLFVLSPCRIFGRLDIIPSDEIFELSSWALNSFLLLWDNTCSLSFLSNSGWIISESWYVLLILVIEFRWSG